MKKAGWKPALPAVRARRRAPGYAPSAGVPGDVFQALGSTGNALGSGRGPFPAECLQLLRCRLEAGAPGDATCSDAGWKPALPAMRSRPCALGHALWPCALAMRSRPCDLHRCWLEGVRARPLLFPDVETGRGFLSLDAFETRRIGKSFHKNWESPGGFCEGRPWGMIGGRRPPGPGFRSKGSFSQKGRGGFFR